VEGTIQKTLKTIGVPLSIKLLLMENEMDERPMIERVKRALLKGLVDDDAIHDLATQVIEAMREPTEAMINRGAGAGAWHPADKPTEEALDVWQAMIDAALEKKP
jgi:hypothetical protein